MEDTAVKTKRPKKSILEIKRIRAQSPRSIVLVGHGRRGSGLARSPFLLNKKIHTFNRNMMSQNLKEMSGFFHDLRTFRHTPSGVPFRKLFLSTARSDLRNGTSPADTEREGGANQQKILLCDRP